RSTSQRKTKRLSWRLRTPERESQQSTYHQSSTDFIGEKKLAAEKPAAAGLDLASRVGSSKCRAAKMNSQKPPTIVPTHIFLCRLLTAFRTRNSESQMTNDAFLLYMGGR